MSPSPTDFFGLGPRFAPRQPYLLGMLKPLTSSSLTFADVFILQPESPLHLLVWVPDGTGLLKAVDSFLDVMVAKLIQQGHKIPARCGPIQGVERIAEGYGETSRKSEDVRGVSAFPGRTASKAQEPRGPQ